MGSNEVGGVGLGDCKRNTSTRDGWCGDGLSGGNDNCQEISLVGSLLSERIVAGHTEECSRDGLVNDRGASCGRVLGSGTNISSWVSEANLARDWTINIGSDQSVSASEVFSRSRRHSVNLGATAAVAEDAHSRNNLVDSDVNKDGVSDLGKGWVGIGRAHAVVSSWGHQVEADAAVEWVLKTS